MSERDLTIKDRLEDILESIGLIEEWSQGMTELHDFMISPGRVMAFNACVMRLQVIGRNGVRHHCALFAVAATAEHGKDRTYNLAL